MTELETLIAESGWLRALAGLVLGAIAGSLVATLLVRWPDRRRALVGRSRCDACGRPLKRRDMVPVVSFFALGGRCRFCRFEIDPVHLILELAAAALGMVVLAFQPGWTGLASAALGWWLLLAAGLDLGRRWLPQVLTLPLVPAGLVLALAGIGPPPVERAAAAAAAFLLLWLAAFAWRRVRKKELLHPGVPLLAAGLGAWLGAWLVAALGVAALLGLVAALIRRTRGLDSASPAPLGALLAAAGWLTWLVASTRPGSLLPY
jgi:leader peptidase (prepilin peptidase)/N-methyltransferase